jgi:hypothetical protein
MRTLPFLLVCAALAGCTQPIILRNPQTGETVDCGPRDAFGTGAGQDALTSSQHAEDCVKDYTARGWLRSPK